ncbi:putative Late nodulin [Medicago truncatula]|uniref:Nodule Cysteine-Rich (NCR) secreted peptide n=1 Tax=Medicago truncatula TaxID=3880 RepID=G7K966_MEDTR|nr:Nodule Cysteine-Rich (NCR) secreted peptide [Medicago truncatula]RHN56037.1 putative Late nodulin [Medicago truncatula]
MAIILKFVYTIILFIYLFLFENSVDGYIKCKTVVDCPYLISRTLVIMCINKQCVAHYIH